MTSLPFASERESADRELYRQVLARKESALGGLFDRYGAVLYGLVLHMLHSADEAERIVHDQFVYCWNSPELFAGNGTTLYAQLASGVHAEAVARIRTRGPRKHSGDITATGLPIAESGPAHSSSPALGETEFGLLLTALRTLPREEQQVLTLAYFDGIRLPEITVGLGISSDRIIHACFHALETIRSLLVGTPDAPAAAHEIEYDEYCGAAALDLLEGDRERIFNDHLRAGCVRCSGRRSLYQEIVSLFQSILPPARVSTDLRERVVFSVRLAEVAKSHYRKPGAGGQKPQTPPAPLRTPFIPSSQPSPASPGTANRSPVSWSVLFFIACGVIICLTYYLNQLQTTMNEKMEYEKTLEGRIFTARSGTGASGSGAPAVLMSPRVTILRMNGTGARIGVTGRFLWSPDSRNAYIAAADLPAPGIGGIYRLWLLKGNAVVAGSDLPSAGQNPGVVFSISRNLDLPILPAEFTAVGITLETPGADQSRPSGRIVLYGRLSS